MKLGSLLSAKKYGTGVILSGGGARGFAHAGILKAINEAGIYPEVISGVSAGAIVGALYADGYTPDEILNIFSRQKSFFKFVKMTVPHKGMFRTVGLRENLEKNLRAKKFSELKIPLFVAATNLNKARVEYFHEGEIVRSVLASSAIPVLFEPVEIEGDQYVDGGVIDNFPVKPVREDCRKLVGISLNPLHPEEDINSLFKIAERTFHLSVSSNIDQKIRMCDMVFEPEQLGSYGLLDASKGMEMFRMGYETASEYLKHNQL